MLDAVRETGAGDRCDRYGRLVRYSRWSVSIALVAAWALLAHYTNTNPGNQTLGTLIALLPIALAVVALAWNARRRGAMLLLVAGGAVALMLAWSRLGQHFSWITWLEHAGTQLVLGLLFARTLAAGREPMCSYFARLVHGSLNAQLQRYTRGITIAWTIFFGLMTATSTALFFAAPAPVWSAFVYFLTVPLTALMFILEYGARRVALPDMEHVSILAAVKAVIQSQTGHAPRAPD
jgi:uncharacterized membrane protein